MLEFGHPYGADVYKDLTSYQKMIQTGEIGVGDYGVGFLNLAIFPIFWNKSGWAVRIGIWTIDDGGAGGYSQPMEKQNSIDLCKKVADEVFRYMDMFPTMDELNEELRPYGIFVGCE